MMPTEGSTGSGRLSFFEHLRVLRIHIIIAFLLIIGGAVVAYIFFDKYIASLISLSSHKLHVMDVVEPFVFKVKLSIAASIFFNIPLAAFNLLLFAAPAMSLKQKLISFSLFVFSAVLFAAGFAYAYFVIVGAAYNFLLSSNFIPDGVSVILNYKLSLRFAAAMIYAFAFAFEFPVFLYALLYSGLVKRSFIVRNFRYAVVFVFIISAMITPPDVVSQLSLALPLLALLGLSVLAAKLSGAGGADV